MAWSHRTMRASLIAFLLLTLSFSAAGTALAALLPLTPGNLVVTYVPDLYDTPIYIREVTSDGLLVQEMATPFLTVEPAVGIITHSTTSLSIYYEYFTTGQDYLSTLDITTGTWDTTRVGNPTQGQFDRDLSVVGNYAFQRDVRVSLRTRAVEFFDTGLFLGVSEVSAGLDHKLYAVTDANPQATIQILDPITLARIGVQKTARGENDQRLHITGISAAENGDIFVSTYPGAVYHFDADLKLLNFSTLTVGGSFSPTTLKLYDSGMIVLGDRFGRVVVTDTTLAWRKVFQVGHDNTYAALVIPEPAAAIHCGSLGALLLACLRRKRWP
jgi:hypothetical protein